MNNQSSSQPTLLMQRIYVKDSSFETPMGAKVFQQQWKPKFTQQIQSRAEKISDNIFEVILTVTITANLAEEPKQEIAYIAEVQQAGIFQLQAENESQIRQMLGATCPAILFPYAREVIDTLAVKGSFPALMMPPINFEFLFQQSLSTQQNPEKVGH